jgi:hypothetical protein
MLRDGLRAAGVAAVTLIFTVPALAGEIYSWRTEDGGYAFTDDAKAIPPRYREQVETRQTEGLGSYARLTAPEPGANAAYSRRLADRLDHLRSLNRNLDAAYAPRPTPSGQTLAVQTGKLNIGVPMDDTGDEPIVIERVRFRHKRDMATRHNLVVRKGGKTLAIVKGKPLVTQINQAPEISEMVD